MKTTFLYLFLCSSLALLVACGKLPEKPMAPDQPATSASAERIQTLLAEAELSQFPLRQDKQLQAASLLLEAEQRGLVDSILVNIQPRALPLPLLAHYADIAARLNIQRGQYQQALHNLETPRLLENLHSLPQPEQLQLNLLKAETHALLGSHIASAQQRIYIAPLLDPADQHRNQQALWQSLMNVPMDELRHYLASSIDGEYKGWLELALIARDNQGDLDQQLRQLDLWLGLWTEHPASSQLPGGLALIQELAENRPQQIALLLPLTGKLAPYGKAVRDGFIAAMYQTRDHGSQVPQIKIYNTQSSTDFIALYQRAVDEGAQLIVGPLEKKRLSQLYDQVSLPVTTLALNRLENYGEPSENLYQFGLVPQDEAQQVADIAFLENNRQALIISPASDWGDKVSDAFEQRWTLLGGKTIARSVYSGQQDYSASIKQALLLDASEARAKRIQQLVGEHIEFSPRRREDIDMIFLLARPQHARSIKPLLAYHYSGNIPVYSTSRLYSGNRDAKDRDLNGVRFTDMPWILGQPSALHQQISSEIPHSKQYQRMYALGADSFQLHPRLRQLSEMTNSRVYGHTGTLKLNSRREIERQMLFARIKNSRASLIPTVDQSLNPAATREGAIHAEEKKY